MIFVDVRPATALDANRFPRVLPDRWAPTGNRRSFVAEALSGAVVGHCRGFDNDLHDATRTIVVEVDQEDDSHPVTNALFEAQLAISQLPIEIHILTGEDWKLQLAKKHGARAIQACPPWRHAVGLDMRRWADRNRAQTVAATAADAQEIAALHAEHYGEQHASWLPAVSEEELRQRFLDHNDGVETGYDVTRSRLLRRDGKLVAAALVWPEEEPGDGCEVTLLSSPYDGPNASPDKAACLADVIDTAQDGDHLLIESHLSLRDEYEMVQEIPGKMLADDSQWQAIAVVPVVDAQAFNQLDASLLPREAQWIRQLID